MLKFSNVGRWPLAAGLMLGGSLCMTAPAFAGHWQMHYELTGKDKYSSDGQSGTINWPTGAQSGSSFQRDPHEATALGDLHIHSGGDVKFVWEWVPDPAKINTPEGDKAPDKIFLKVTSTVTADGAPMNASISPGLGYELDNGLGVTRSNSGGGVASSKKLVTVDASGGRAVYELKGLKAHMGIDEFTPEWDGQVFNVHINATAEEDLRSVKLTRSGQDRSELKNGEWTTYGDTTYSHNVQNPPDPLFGETTSLYENRQTIVAALGGTWTKHTQGDDVWGVTETYGESHSWSPPGEQDSSTSSKRLMPTGKLILGAASGKWYGTAGEGSHTDKNITYTITDPDGATATAHYKLTIHEPVEKISSTTKGLSVDVDYFNSSGQPHINSSTIRNSLSTTSGESQTSSIVGTIGADLFGIPLGLELGTESTTTDEESKTLEAYDGPLGLNEYVNAKKQLNYNRNHVLFWKYNEGGKERRFVNPIGPPPIGGWSQSDKIEVPHEAISTKFSNWGLFWSDPKRSDEGGYPTTATPQPTLPPPSFYYSRKEGKKHG